MNTMKFIGLIVCSFSITAFSANNLHLASLKNLNTIVVDPTKSKHIYLAVTNHGIYKSYNDGHTFKSLGLNNVDIKQLAINHKQPNNLFALGNLIDDNSQLLFSSSDYGIHWNQINAFNTSIDSFVIDPVNPSTMYVSALNYLYKSVDGGKHWQNSRLPDYGFMNLTIDPNNHTVLYARSGEKVFKSYRNIESWEHLATINSKYHATTLAIHPRRPNILFMGFYHSIYCSDSDDDCSQKDVINGGIVKSTDGGYTWYQTKGATSYTISEIIFDQTNPFIMYASTYYEYCDDDCGNGHGILKSIDGGETWFFTNLPEMTVSGLIQHPKIPEKIYATTTENGLYISEDGINWQSRT